MGWSDGGEETYFRFESFAIKDSSKIRFWEVKWLCNASLPEHYPALYLIVRGKYDTLAHVLSSSSPDIFSDGI